MNKFHYLEQKLKYTFINKKILFLSLTHRSYSNNHNERLEFLGDSILNFIITKKIYKKFYKKKEGFMTRIRANLVNKNNLSKIAQKLKLNKYILLGQGELKMLGQYKISILANTLEAIIGAIFIDSKNILIIENIIKKLFFNYKNNKILNKKNNQKDYKTILQEYLQKIKLPLPKYYISDKKGKEHKQIFIVKCKINLLKKITKGIGYSKKEAEQKSAKKSLIKIGLIKNNNVKK